MVLNKEQCSSSKEKDFHNSLRAINHRMVTRTLNRMAAISKAVTILTTTIVEARHTVAFKVDGHNQVSFSNLVQRYKFLRRLFRSGASKSFNNDNSISNNGGGNDFHNNRRGSGGDGGYRGVGDASGRGRSNYNRGGGRGQRNY